MTMTITVTSMKETNFILLRKCCIGNQLSEATVVEYCVMKMVEEVSNFGSANLSKI
jgi:hypothetical protein